jgi:branched-chain amino acid aminotransferase
MSSANPSTHPLVYFEGKVVPWEDARLHVFSPAVKYGAGVFEGIRGYYDDDSGRMYIFRLAEHLKRLQYSQLMMRFDPIVDSQVVHDALLELMRANDFKETVHIRTTVYVDGEGESGARGPTGLTITAVPRPLPKRVKDGVSAQVSSWRRIPDQSMPMRAKANANYNNSRMAAMQASEDGYGAAILLNDRGKVSEGPGMCLFMVRDGVPTTPSVTSDILESITRETVLQLLGEDMGFAPVQRDMDRSELVAAEEVFFCGTGWEITPVTHVDRIPIGDGTPGPVTRDLQKRYFDLVHGRSNAHPEWRTEV